MKRLNTASFRKSFRNCTTIYGSDTLLQVQGNKWQVKVLSFDEWASNDKKKMSKDSSTFKGYFLFIRLVILLNKYDGIFWNIFSTELSVYKNNVIHYIDNKVALLISRCFTLKDIRNEHLFKLFPRFTVKNLMFDFGYLSF